MLSRRILLIEPGYPNKYPPLGLMKLAAYHGSYGRGDHVTFVKGEDNEVLSQAWDRVYVTTLFTFEWKRTTSAIAVVIITVTAGAYLFWKPILHLCELNPFGKNVPGAVLLRAWEH